MRSTASTRPRWRPEPWWGAHSVRAVARSRRMSPTLPTRLSSARAERRALPSNWRPEPGSAAVPAFRAGIQRHAPASWTAPVLWRFWTECSSQKAPEDWRTPRRSARAGNPPVRWGASLRARASVCRLPGRICRPRPNLSGNLCRVCRNRPMICRRGCGVIRLRCAVRPVCRAMWPSSGAVCGSFGFVCRRGCAAWRSFCAL
jgi:hypothetical protein